MKRQFKRLAVIAITAVIVMTTMAGLTGCQSSDKSYKSEDGNTIKLQYAKNFNIEYLDNNNKIVTDGEGKQMLLLQKGQEAPAEYKDLPAITIPIDDAIYTSTTQVGFLRAFDDETLFDSIVGVRMKAEDWDFDAMKNRMLEGKIKDIGSNSATSSSYDYEIIQSLNPKIVFTATGMGSEQQKLMEMLTQNNIPYLYDSSSTEADYRGTMEWMKFYSAFYNLEKEATEYYDKAMKRIDEMKAKVENTEKPKVAWAIISSGKIYVQNAGSKAAQMVRDAGGEYLFDDIGVGKDSVSVLTPEEFYSRVSKADYYINSGMPKYGPDIKSITDQVPVVADLPIYSSGNVWQITDNFWSTYHTIDQKYLDLAAIFHPELYPDYEVTQFVNMPAVAK
ncbi:ABC transporter substrate-binding protein [Acetobacterium woodii]|uniref:Putative iron (III) ABC transport system substrate-binding protein n=1 Tax=Acetobacterium woodii (strain ATCC 29683 / DSM 1030 / JCM 2381 / KCTC 1655 / WB1) TaxID=931626 RepID=H6LCN5_ACEWD|nr:ABC transporter substrate-binding protein [Acetobacterium woodii]AFA47817.1 putative iron (III) ABC transport system substrate-binding protein [Acetobacterium woodii DSM 1030]